MEARSGKAKRREREESSLTDTERRNEERSREY